MGDNIDASVTCELCGSLFIESRRRYYCAHCQKYYFVCSRCREKGAKCRFCGIPTRKQSEPLSHRVSAHH